MPKTLPPYKPVDDIPQKAYDFWKKNNGIPLNDIASKFKCSPDRIKYFMRRMKLERPDGKVFGGKTPRQEAIKAAYEKAVRENLNAGQAAKWVETETSHDVNRADIQYYAMKNNLPYLPEADNMRSRVGVPLKR